MLEATKQVYATARPLESQEGPPPGDRPGAGRRAGGVRWRSDDGYDVAV